MSEKAVMEIIDKAVSDKAFRQKLFNNSPEALKGYELTDEEKEMLSGLNEENFDQFAGGLGDRTTKGSWVPGG